MPTDNLTPEQRKAVRRVRQALKLVPEPERRVIMAALKELWQVTAPLFADIEAFQTAMAPVLAHIEHRIAKEYAVRLALEERLGHEPEDGETITAADEQRAEVIVKMYPPCDT